MIWKSLGFGPKTQGKMCYSLRNSLYTFPSLPPNTIIRSKTLSMNFCEISPQGFWPLRFEITEVNEKLKQQRGGTWRCLLEKHSASPVIVMSFPMPSQYRHGTYQILGQNIKEALLWGLSFQVLNHLSKSCHLPLFANWCLPFHTIHSNFQSFLTSFLPHEAFWGCTWLSVKTQLISGEVTCF